MTDLRRGAVRPGPRTILRALAARLASAAARPLPTIRTATAGDDPNVRKNLAAIYVSYDPTSLVADYVIAQVAALAATGRRVTFISNSPQISQHDITRLQPFVRDIVHRRNFGHDFGAYKDGIARLKNLETLDSLVLMNDSCYGPFGGLARVEHAAIASGADLFGVTDSWSIAYHLQSYFLWIGPAALRARAFTEFWRRLLRIQPRNMVISTGEILFTRTLQQAGLAVAALHPYSQIAEQARTAALHSLATDPNLAANEQAYLRNLVSTIQMGEALNPMHAFWDVLLRNADAPFLKRDLLLRNPAQTPGVNRWEILLAAGPAEDRALIKRDLVRAADARNLKSRAAD